MKNKNIYTITEDNITTLDWRNMNILKRIEVGLDLTIEDIDMSNYGKPVTSSNIIEKEEDTNILSMFKKRSSTVHNTKRGEK